MTRDDYAPSRTRCQAKVDLTRGRTKKAGLPAGEVPGQLSIEDVLAEIAAEQAQTSGGGERS